MNGQSPSCESLFLLPFALEVEQREIPFDIQRIAPSETEATDTVARSTIVPSKLIFRGHEMHGAPLNLPQDYVIVLRGDSGMVTAHSNCIVFSEPGDCPQPSPITVVDLYRIIL